jgi:hypothetical protein
MDTIFGKKLYELIDLDDTIVKSYYTFLSEVPVDYQGVESVTLDGRKIKVEEYGHDPGRRIVLDFGGILAAEEDVIIIDGGLENGGSLEQTINGDTIDTGERANPFRIYELITGETYYQHGPIDVDNPDGVLTIRGQEGGRKPVILKKVVDDNAIGTNRINSSLTLQNVQYHTLESDSGMAFTAWNILGIDHTLRVEGCLFEHCNGRLFNLNDVRSGAEIVIRDNYFRDLHAFEQWWGGSIVECKVPVDSFFFENNTVSGGGLTILGQECLFDYAVINHNTFINNHKYPFLNHYWKELYFTNNLFVNANMAGEDLENISNGGGILLDARLHGIIGVDSIHPDIRIQGRYLNADSTALTDEVNGLDDIIYYAADNVLTYSTILDPYYHGTVDGVWQDAPASYLTWGGKEGPFKVLNVPGIWNNDRTKAWIAAYGNLRDENNHIYIIALDSLGLATDPLPQDAADVFVQWNRYQWAVPDVERPTDFSAYYFGDYDPATIPGIETEDSDAGGITKISDMTEDFSYALDLTSKSDGLPIGALHWEYEIFDREASLVAVKIAYAGTVAVVEIPSPSSRFELTNYPNPFRQETVISYKLSRKGRVHLEILDAVGRPVRVLVDEIQPAGNYLVPFQPDGLPAGLYFYRITSWNSQQQEKMICIGR